MLAVITLSSILSQSRNNTFMISSKKVSVPVPVCVLAVCSSVCSAWSRSFTSSSRASCNLLLFLFSFFRRFWIRTEWRRRRGTDDKGCQKSLQVNVFTNQINQMLLIFLYLTSFESIVVWICLLYFRVVSPLPDLPGSLHQEIWGTLKVLWAWSVCCDLNCILISE